jgi:hypothetical protein
MMRVHFITAEYIDYLENSVNTWLQRNAGVEVIDIKYGPVPRSHSSTNYSVMIIYK